MNDTSTTANTSTSPTATPSVKFTSREDFLAELARDGRMVHRRIVRAACSVRRPDPMIRYQELHVLAGYVVTTDTGELQLVELDCACGAVTGHDDEDAPVRALAATELASIRDAITKAGLDCRTGRFVAGRATQLNPTAG